MAMLHAACAALQRSSQQTGELGQSRFLAQQQFWRAGVSGEPPTWWACPLQRNPGKRRPLESQSVTSHNVLGRIDATQYGVEVGLNQLIAQA